MIQLHMRPFIALCCTMLCLASSSLFAQEGNQKPFPEVIPVEQSFAAEDEINEENPFIQKIGRNFPYDDSFYLKRLHQSAYNHLLGYTDKGDVVQMYDGSKWSINPTGRKKVLTWADNDDIFIKPNASCFSWNNYVFHNRTTKEVVWASLINPPLPMGVYTYIIENIHPFDPLVLLSNDTVWKIDPSARSSIKIGQRVLIGVNNNWRTAALPQILILADKPRIPYCEALFYGYPILN